MFLYMFLYCNLIVKDYDDVMCTVDIYIVDK